MTVDPVNVTMSTPGWSASTDPTSVPSPQTTLSAPAGSPASEASRASVSVVSGVSSLGLITTVAPAATAGITFQTAICSG